MIKLVIIDDDSLVCQALKTILESSGKVEVAAIGHDGSQALELFETHKPDILLMDIRMANVTGIQAGRGLLEKHPDAKLLYLTTFADNEYIVDALKIGAKGYLPALKLLLNTFTGTRIVNGTPIVGAVPCTLGCGLRAAYVKPVAEPNSAAVSVSIEARS